LKTARIPGRTAVVSTVATRRGEHAAANKKHEQTEARTALEPDKTLGKIVQGDIGMESNLRRPSRRNAGELQMEEVQGNAQKHSVS
jgi:hypothetical protein